MKCEEARARRTKPSHRPPAPLFYSSSFCSPHSLCLSESLFICSHFRLACRGSLNNRSDSFSTFAVVWCCRSSMRCQRCTIRTTSSGREPRCQQTTRRICLVQTLELLTLQALAMGVCWEGGGTGEREREGEKGRPAASWSDVTCQFQLRNHHLPRSATQATPVRSIPYITQWLSRPTFASYKSTFADTRNFSRSIMTTNKEFLSHAACK